MQSIDCSPKSYRFSSALLDQAESESPQKIDANPRSFLFSHVVSSFNQKWSREVLRETKRQARERHALKAHNLYLEHLTNQHNINYGNAFERIYYSVKDALTQRRLASAKVSLENAFIYFPE